MSLPPIPKRKGMVAYSAEVRDGRWCNVLYRPEVKERPPEKPTRKDRGLVGTSQGELGL